MQEIPKDRNPRRPSVIGLGVGQVLRPSLAPSTAFAPTPSPTIPRRSPSSPTMSPGLVTSTASPIIVSRRQRQLGPAPFWRVSQPATETTSPSKQRVPSSCRSSSLALGSQHQHYLPPINDDMPERVGSASSSRAVHSTEAAGVWPPSRRTSSLFNRRGTLAFPPGISGSVHDLGERSSSKLTLDEELYDLLFAYG